MMDRSSVNDVISNKLEKICDDDVQKKIIIDLLQTILDTSEARDPTRLFELEIEKHYPYEKGSKQ